MILAIETSHDDTSLALYENRKIIWEKTVSQTEFHKQFGGTVPEFAARHHFKNISIILEELKGKYDLTGLDHIAYTYKPGLIGSLHMGQLFANALGLALSKPVHKINHMYGHIYAVHFEFDITYPSLALIVSGGHTQLWNVKSPTDINLIGETRDDAAGEVFDKVARKLKLGFPGGPLIESEAAKVSEGINFNLTNNHELNFSFSGLKTKVINYVHNLEQKGQEIDHAAIAHGFQTAVVKSLIETTKQAIEEYKPASIILGGGVAANTVLRTEFALLHPVALIPSKKYTTDNASMIAARSDVINSK